MSHRSVRAIHFECVSRFLGAVSRRKVPIGRFLWPLGLVVIRPDKSSRGGYILNEIKVYSSACVLGGLLRLISSFVGYDSASESIEVLYIATDLCLILGLFGFYLACRAKLFWLGHLGFVAAVWGFSFIAGPETDIFGVSVYQLGSPIVGLGVLLLSINMIRANLCGFVAPVSLMASVAIGLISTLVGGSLLFFLTGALFGVGFMALGIAVWRTS